MGQVIGPIPRNWWLTLQTIRKSVLSERANGNSDVAKQEWRCFKSNLGRFVQAEDLSAPVKAA
jgi:hypothetical protein